MSSSLKDQLLGLGFKASPKPEKPAQPTRHTGKRSGKPSGKASTGAPQHVQGPTTGKAAGMDLAKAYALRGEQEKREREAAEREKQEKARLRREAKQKLDAFMSTQTVLNAAEADQVRHFDYGGKIKRIHVTAEQLAALNRGELGVLQINGRYLLVTAECLTQAKSLYTDAVALEVDPDAPIGSQASGEQDYDDPKYRIPDDLTW